MHPRTFYNQNYNSNHIRPQNSEDQQNFAPQQNHPMLQQGPSMQNPNQQTQLVPYQPPNYNNSSNNRNYNPAQEQRFNHMDLAPEADQQHPSIQEYHSEN